LPEIGFESQLIAGAYYVRRWNTIAINASGLDHTASPYFRAQLGPDRSSRAMAIAHIAMYDAINAVSGRFPTYSGVHHDQHASMDVTIVEAAHDALVALFPLQSSIFDTALTDDLESMPAGKHDAKSRGIALGQAAATAILALRANDGSQFIEEHVGVDFTPNTLITTPANRATEQPLSEFSGPTTGRPASAHRRAFTIRSQLLSPI
jgi:hypothetical protein